ncbi:MAG TPA: PD-(D/E)XK nuclease family protein [Acidimicrobiales bacterium]|nr:PD-(D/E)XK nuclease family protein [Acidimicrobiales bacterium]
MANRSHGVDRVPKPDREDRVEPWVVAATDLTFLWGDCPRCFYRKVVEGVPRPRGPVPTVFGRIDRAMKIWSEGYDLARLPPEAPVGVVRWTDRWVKSQPLAASGSPGHLVIRGRLDALVACDDGTTGVIDFKTTDPNTPNLALYSRQLHAYASALEHPAVGQPVTVGVIGLLSFSPDTFTVDADGNGSLVGGLCWHEVPRDDAAFALFLLEVLSVLSSPEPPPASCPWCHLVCESSDRAA